MLVEVVEAGAKLIYPFYRPIIGRLEKVHKKFSDQQLATVLRYFTESLDAMSDHVAWLQTQPALSRHRCRRPMTARAGSLRPQSRHHQRPAVSGGRRDGRRRRGTTRDVPAYRSSGAVSGAQAASGVRWPPAFFSSRARCRVSAAGQAPEVRAPLTLAAALEIAEARSESVALAQTALVRNEGDFVRAKSGAPPAAVGHGHLRALAGQRVPGRLRRHRFRRWGRRLREPRWRTCRSGRANTWRATLSFSQNVYSGGRLAAQDTLVAVGRRSAEQALAAARAQVLFDVTQAYFDAALSGRLVAIAEATFDQADATLRQVQAGFDAGIAAGVRSAARAGEPRQPAAAGDPRSGSTATWPCCVSSSCSNLPPDAELQLAEGLDDERLAPPQPFVGVGRRDRKQPARQTAPRRSRCSRTLPLPERNAVAEAQTAVQSREASLVAVQAERRPTVNLTSNYSRIAYPEVLLPAFNRTNWSIGASVTMPFMTGGRQKGDEMVARADVEQARIQLRQMEELAALDTRSTWAELVAARAAWAATSGTVQQATRAYEIARGAVPGRPLDTARAERCPAAVAAGRGESRAGGARPASGAGAGGAAAQPAARGRWRQPARGAAPTPAPQPAPAPPQQQRQFQNVSDADRRRANGSEITWVTWVSGYGVVVLAPACWPDAAAEPEAPAAAGAPCRRADWTGERRHGRSPAAS